jgi:hypothetical protein
MNECVHQHVHELAFLISTDPEIRSHVVKQSRTLRNKFFKHYLAALPMCTKENRINSIVLADVGWNGTIQKCLDKIFSSAPFPRPILTGAYMLTTHNAPINSKGMLADHGLPSLQASLFMRSPEIIERMLTPLEWGTTIGFDNDGNPVTSAASQNVLSSFLSNAQHGVREFVRLASQYKDCIARSVLNVDSVQWLFCHLLRQTCRPYEDEVQLFANWIHDDNLSLDNQVKLVNSPLMDLLRIGCSAPILASIDMHECYWIWPLLYASSISDVINMHASSLNPSTSDDIGPLTVYVNSGDDLARIECVPLSISKCQIHFCGSTLLREKSYLSSLLVTVFSKMLLTQNLRITSFYAHVQNPEGSDSIAYSCEDLPEILRSSPCQINSLLREDASKSLLSSLRVRFVSSNNKVVQAKGGSLNSSVLTTSKVTIRLIASKNS